MTMTDRPLDELAEFANRFLWRSVKDDPPPKDGRLILFGHRLPWSAGGSATLGFWHTGQNVPGWMATPDYGVILEEVWPYWMPLPDPPTAIEDD